ncbi:MAG: hypothetical protein ACOCYD_01125 [bacterium]
MKKLIFTSVFAFLFAAGSWVQAQNPQQEYLGLPGDNLNLFAVMDLFQESETLEAFERGLNDPEAMINNLDLNNDGYVDYIMVQDYKEDNLHNIVLRVALNQDEYQDVAVFVVEVQRDGSALVQLIGDEALYGPNYIVEPNYAERPNPGYQGNVSQSPSTTVVHTTYHEVAQWPVIIYISRPVYRPWRSSWYWGYHPTWWSPWNPHYYHYYYGYHYHWHGHYHAYYRPWRRVRCTHYHTVYVTNHRHTSTTVVNRIENGRYRDTYSRPEKIQEGQQLFAQRHPGRYEKVATNTKVSQPALRQSPNSVQQVKQSPARGVDSRNAATERRQENAVRQSNGDTRRQSPAVNQSRDNRDIEQNNARQQSKPVRSESPEINRSRESSKPVIQRKATPARESKPTPQRNVKPSSRERNTSSPQRKPSGFNSSSNRSSSPAVSSPPARSNRQPSSNVKSSGSSRNSSAPSRSNSSRKSSSSRENNKRSERR